MHAFCAVFVCDIRDLISNQMPMEIWLSDHFRGQIELKSKILDLFRINQCHTFTMLLTMKTGNRHFTLNEHKQFPGVGRSATERERREKSKKKKNETRIRKSRILPQIQCVHTQFTRF